MSNTTFEEAKQCPKCSNPGEDRITRIAKGMKPGTTTHHIYCMSVLCPWYDTCWIVQVNPDGSIPPATNHVGQPKVYEGFEGHDKEATDLIDELKRSAAKQTEDGYEIRRNR